MRNKAVISVLLISLLSLFAFGQDAAPPIETRDFWSPPEGVPVYTLTGKQITLRTKDGAALEQPISILGKFNRLYVFDGKLGHAYLFDANEKYLTQLTDPRQPSYLKAHKSGGWSIPLIYDADSFGRLLLRGLILVDGLQYYVPAIRFPVDAVLFQSNIVVLEGTFNHQHHRRVLKVYSRFGGEIAPPWLPAVESEGGMLHHLMASTDEKLYLLDTWEKLLTVIDASGDSQTIHLDEIHYIFKKQPEGRVWSIPSLRGIQIYKNALYFKINTRLGKNYICAFSHNYELTAVYELPDSLPNSPTSLHEFAVCQTGGEPTFYAVERDWETKPSTRRLMRYRPSEIAKAPVN